jgi:hypothetical protein
MGYKPTQAMLKKSRKKKAGALFTHGDAKVFTEVFNILEGAYGEEAQDYFRRLVKLMPQYQRLIDKGVNVRIARQRIGRRPLLIIDS